MLVMGKIKPVQIIFYLAAAIVFIVYTPLLLKYRSKKQVKRIERYHVPNEMTFNDEGIQVEFADKKETYEWEQIQKVVTTPKTIGFYYETEICPVKDVYKIITDSQISKEYIRKAEHEQILLVIAGNREQ